MIGKRTCIALLFASAFSANAVASNDWSMSYGQPYLGASYTFNDFDIESNDISSHVTSITVRAGMQFNQYLSAELRLGGGVRDDVIDQGVAEVDRHYGGYIRAGLPAWLGHNDSAMFRPYIVAGLTDVRFTVAETDYNESGLSYGAGFEFSANDKFIFNLEFMRTIDIQDMYFEQVSVGFNYQF